MMNDSVVDVTVWQSPVSSAGRKEYAVLLKSKKKASSYIINKEITQYNLYCYLKARFGEPNGLAMTLRSSTTDNLIQWNYLIKTGKYFIDFLGFNTHSQIVILGDRHFNDLDFRQIITNIKADFKNHGERLKQVRASFEKWRLFVNPYKRLTNIVTAYERKLKALHMENVSLPPNPNTKKEIRAFSRKLDKCFQSYSQAIAYGTSLSMIAPVWGESFINLLIFLCAKQEIKDDERLYQDVVRAQIDIRVKTLHLHCDGFAKPIDSEREEFKAFHTLMNSRNDFLHGNIDPDKLMYDEVFFDHGTIPLFNSTQNYAERALVHTLKFVEPTIVLQKVTDVRSFIHFVLGHLEPEYKEQVEMFMETEIPGWRDETRRAGILFPDTIVEMLVGKV